MTHVVKHTRVFDIYTGAIPDVIDTFLSGCCPILYGRAGAGEL
jgi:hypothetical protein